ncbi:MAG: DUF504 domain-containing protein [Alphaproteobacteria bacterium]|nr:DUF504 domain-containing protein [Alphaproteobacteria bacterium]
MQTSERVYHRVRWDPRLDPTCFVIGVDVHAERPKRVPLIDFVPGGDIPWHRVLFFEADGELVWDRRTGLDRMDETLAGRIVRAPLLRSPTWTSRTVHLPTVEETRTGPLRVLTWNTLFDRFDQDRIHTARRRPLIVGLLEELDADVVALQEVQRPLMDALLATPTAARSWVVAHEDVDDHGLVLLSRRPVLEAAWLPLGRHKGVLAAVVDTGERPVAVLTTHLLSDHARDGARRRAQQLDQVAALVAELDADVIVVGDFNDDSDGPQRVLAARDAWEELALPVEPTFDPVENPLAAVSSLSGRAVRIDRVLLRGELRALSARRVGTAAVDGLFPSDHFGVLAELASTTPTGLARRAPNARSALCWVLPEDHADAVQTVRREHDPSFERWPPHVNVQFGWVGEHELDEVLPALADALATAAPFDARFEGLSSFRHREGGTVWLEPADAEPWRALHRACEGAVPVERSRPTFTPHLTVGRSDRPEADAVAWRPRVGRLEARVERLTVLTRRADEPMRPRATIALGTGQWTWCRPEPVRGLLGPPRPVEDLLERLRGVLPDAGLTLVGSRALGCGLADADLDLVGTGEPREVARRLRALEGAGSVRVLEATRALGVQLEVDGVGVDLALIAGDEEQRAVASTAIDDARAWLEAVGDRVDEARALLRVVKAWARVQGLDAAPFGGLPGVGWAVLVARTVLDAPAGAVTPAAFFERWAGHPDGTWVTLGPTPDDEGTGLRVACPAAPLRSCSDTVGPAGMRLLREALLAAWMACEDARDPSEELLRPPDLHRTHRAWLLVEARAEAALLPDVVGRARGRFRQLLATLEDQGGLAPRAWPWPVAHGADQRTWAIALGHVARSALDLARDWVSGMPGVSARISDAGGVPTLPIGRGR